ncbi:MAG: cbb3-type cytochrome c oxidase subunit I, partial [Gammaproteobacteria bacterium]|nr:cbb3-type cytochrome c oxidase subunit I [Gammaproteobacteria bacterium]
TYTLLMLVAWLWLASASNVRLALSPRVALIFFGFGLIAVFFTPIIYYSYAVTSTEHIMLFTWLMQYGGSLAALPLSLALLHGLWRSERAQGDAQPLRAALIASMILFGAGGVIGFLISGTNVTIPAHYHGSIVGVTLAFMGLTYYLLPHFGYRQPDMKLGRLQPWLYGGGQLLHVLGLVISGGYGVQRKVAGAAQELDTVERVAGMGLMGLGGMISIVGGFLFIYVCYRAMRSARVNRDS